MSINKQNLVDFWPWHFLLYLVVRLYMNTVYFQSRNSLLNNWR